MKRYQITITAVVEADDEQEAENVAQQILNTDLDDEIEANLEQLHYHDGYGNPEITEMEV